MQEHFLNDERKPSNHKLPTDQQDNLSVKNLLAPSLMNPQAYEPLNRVEGRQSQGHCRSLVATLFLIVGAILAFVLRVVDNTVFSLLIFLPFYFVYLALSCCSNQLMNQLKTLTGSASFTTYYEQLRASTGLFAMHADCYHYETRQDSRTVTDSDGNTKTETTTYQVAVTSHTDHLDIIPIFTQDESGRLEDFNAHNEIVTVNFNLLFYHLDLQSQRKLQEIYMNFKMRNMKDSYQTFTIKYVIPNMIMKKSFMFKEAGCDYSSWFYLFGLIGLIWPYSLWIESKIDRYEVKLRKGVKL